MLPSTKTRLLQGISVTFVSAGLLLVLYGLRNIQHIITQSPGNATGQGQLLDLNDPNTANKIRNLVFLGLEPGTLQIDDLGNVITQTVQDGPGNDELPSATPANVITGALTPVSSGWTQKSGAVILSTTTDNVGIGVTSPTDKLQVNGNIVAGLDDSYSLGSDVNRWQRVNVGMGGVNIVNSYTDVANYERGGLAFSEYTVPLPGVSTVFPFQIESNFTEQELKGGASSYTAVGLDVTTNGAISSLVKVGCRINLNGQWYDITTIVDGSHFSVATAPAVFGEVSHVYCTTFSNNRLQLNSNTTIGPGDLNQFTQHYTNATATYDTWAKPIVYASAINKYVAGGYIWDSQSSRYHATIYESSDLTTWTERILDTSASDTQIKNMIYEENSGRIVAAGYDNTNGTESFVVWESTDAVNWNKHVVQGNGSYWDGPQLIVYDTVANRYVYGALYYNGSNYTLDAWESTDLINWTIHNVEAFTSYPNVTSLIYAPDTGKFVFGGSFNYGNGRRAVVWESSDLLTWTRRSVDPSTSGGSRVTAMAFDSVNGKYLGMGWNQSSNSIVWESTDLVNWTSHIFSTESTWPASIMYNELSGKYIIGGEARDAQVGYWRGALWYSDDLVNWTVVRMTPSNVDARVMGLSYDPVNGRFLGAGMTWGNYDQATVWATEPGTIFSYPTDEIYATVTSAPVNTATWLEINGISVDETLNGQNAIYALSFDDRATWSILQSGQTQWRNIVRNSNGMWQYNTNVAYENETWVNSVRNTQEDALSVAMELAINRMSSSALNTFTNTDFALSGGFIAKSPTINIAVGLSTTSQYFTPIVRNILFSYENSRGGPALTLSSQASGSGTVKPFQLQIGTHDSAMFVDENGHVGFGTNDPQGLFDVNGLFTISQNGDVGIGNVTPGYKLDVAGGIHATGDIDTDGAVNTLDATITGTLNAANQLNIGSFTRITGGLDIKTGNITMMSDVGWGKFATPLLFQTQSMISKFAMEDYDHDGKSDIASINSSNTLTVSRSSLSGYLNQTATYLTGNNSFGISAGDINGDTFADIITANNAASSISVFINNNDGTFANKVDYSVGSQPYSIAIGDVNGDTYKDLIVSNSTSNSVSVLFNNGAGIFGAATNYAVGGWPEDVSLGDINNDGFKDIIVVNSTSNSMSVLLNNGTGAFPTRNDFTTGSSPQELGIKDINGDGFDDCVVVNYSSASLSVFLNNGGTFTTGSLISTTSSPIAIALNDVDYDNIADIVLSFNGSAKMSVYKGIGNGSFETPVDFVLQASPSSDVATADVSGDGKLDLVVSYWGGYSVYVNESSMGFLAQSSTGRVGIGTTTPGYKLDVQDGQINASGGLCIDGDCKSSWLQLSPGYRPYILQNGLTHFSQGVSFGDNGTNITSAGRLQNVTSYSGGEMLLQRAGTLSAGIQSSVGSNPYAVALGDFTGEGVIDAIVVNSGSNNVSLMQGVNNGTFSGMGTLATGNNPYAVAVGDINADGLNDFVVANYGSNTISVFMSIPGFIAWNFSKTDYLTGMSPSSVVLAELTGDTYLDIAVANYNSNTMSIFVNNGDGTYQTKVDYASGINPRGIAAGDVNKDRKVDIFTADSNSNTISMFKNQGNGTFSPRVAISTSGNPYSVVMGNFFGQNTDLAVARVTQSSVAVYNNNGRGDFGSSSSSTVSSGPYSLAQGDLNGDGYNEIVSAGSSSNQISVFTPTTGGVVSYSAGSGPAGVAVGDVNRDSVNDVVVVNSGSNTMMVYLNQKSPMFYTQLSTGFVGIGTMTPGYKLDVQGGQVNASGGLCIAGDCKTSWSQLQSLFVPYIMNGSLSNFAGGVSVNNSGTRITSQGNITGVGRYQGGEMLLTRATTFSAKNDYSILTPASMVVAGDLNGDSIPDAVVPATNSVSVLMGTSAATLSARVNYSYSCSSGGDAVIGDFNGDGWNDIVVACLSPANIVLLLNNKNGTFAGPTYTASTGAPMELVAGDFTGDGRLDIVASYTSTGIGLFANLGTGTFASGLYHATDARVEGLDSSDFNNDGRLDIVVSIPSLTEVSIFMNNASGSFLSKVDYATYSAPTGVAAGDVTGDGRADLVLAHVSNNRVSVMPNSGNGVFSSNTTYITGGGPYGPILADFSGDGLLDVATGNNSGGSISVLVNTGSGILGAKSDYTAGVNPKYLTYTDFNRDGGNDIFVVNASGGTVSVFINQVSSMFYAQASTGFIGIGTVTPGYKLDVQGGQINTSGGLCIAGDCKTSWSQVGLQYSMYTVQNGVSNFVSGLSVGRSSWNISPNGNMNGVGSYQGGELLLARGGTFGAKVDYAANLGPGTIKSGDLNGDNKPDIVLRGPSQVSVYINNGDGTYAAKVDYPVTGGSSAVTIFDANGDGFSDIVASQNYNGGYLSVLVNNGSGIFTVAGSYPVGCTSNNVESGDFNGDRFIDVVVQCSGSVVSVFLNNGSGVFSTKSDYATGFHNYSYLSLGDVSGDGKLDIVSTNDNSNTISVLKNNGDGTFAAKVDYATGTQPNGVSVRDVNDDGKSDVIVTNYANSTVSVFKNNGNGTLAAKVDYATGASPVNVVARDLNGDGKQDLVTSNYASNTVSVLKNNGNGTFATKVDYATGANPYGLEVDDFNKDGQLDIVAVNLGPGTISIFLNQTTPMFYAQASTGFVGIGTVTPAVNLDVAGAFRVAGNITSNNPSMATGALASAPLSGTCTGQLNTSIQAVFQSTATITTSHIFYNATRTRHSRISSVTNCTDGTSVQYRIVALQDAITGNTTADSYTVYNPTSDIGDSASGFFKTIYAVNINGLTSTLSGGFDLAEQYKTNDDTITEGEVVSIAANASGSLTREPLVEKAGTESDSRVIGVVSTNPGLTFGSETEGTWVRVALAGRVPVRVSTINGTITAGDFLTSSSMPGVAVKAIKPGMVIGRALQDFVCPEGEDTCVGMVDMFVNLTWYSPWSVASSPVPVVTVEPTPTPVVASDSTDTAQSGIALIKASNSMVTVTYAGPYTQAPILTVTTKKTLVTYEIVNESESGFTIKLTTPAIEDVTFVWVAFSAQSAQSSVSTE